VSTETLVALPAWVGPAYRKAGLRGVRLAVLADKEPERTGDIARVGRGLDCTLTAKYIDGTMPHREFTDVARMVLGHAAERPECEDFWRAVAFTNSADPSGGTRRRPVVTDDDRELTRRSFRDFLDQVEPEALLVFGRSLMSQLEQDPEILRRLRPLAARTVIVTHPGTAGFSFREHLEEVKNLGLG